MSRSLVGVLVWAALISISASASEPLPELRGIEAPVASNAWDRAVAFQLLVTYDTNGSGQLDRGREVKAIPCEAWTSLDEVIAEGSTFPGLLVTYGFRKDLHWIGDALGFHKRARRSAVKQMRLCGVSEEGPHLGPPPDTALGEMVAGMITVVPEPGSPMWFQQIRDVIGITYDDDGSRTIDTPAELRSVPCLVWFALDMTLIEAGRGGLTEVLWPRGGLWGGDRLGLDESLEANLVTVLGGCGVFGGL